MRQASKTPDTIRREKYALNELLRYMKAMVVLQVATLTREDTRVPIEVLLHRAGLDIGEIAELLGKSYPAVAKAISRARGKKGRPATKED